MRTKVMVADGYPLVTGLLRELIGQAQDMESVGEAHSRQQLVGALRAGDPRVLLLGMGLCDANGIEVIRQVRAEYPHIAVCVICFSENPRACVMPVLRAGAAGFVTKWSTPEVILDAVRRLARGERFADETALDGVMLDMASGDGRRGRTLSQREFQVLQMLTEGKPTSEIAEVLNLSPKTVNTHRTRLYQKLHVNSIAELVRYTFEQGIEAR